MNLEKTGLEIVYSHFPYDGPITNSKDPTYVKDKDAKEIRSINVSRRDYSKEILFADIYAKTGTPSKRFITTPEIRSALVEDNFRIGTAFGRVKFTYHKKNRLLEYSVFFPLPVNLETADLGRNWEAAKAVFTKKGIASMIETKVLDHAMKVFPRATRVSIYKPQIAMRRRIRALGFNYKEQLKLKEFRATLRGKVAKDIRTARSKRAIALRH